LNIVSLPRKKTRRRMNSRGFSSIVGAIFMMLIVWVLASAYFFFTLSQNTAYNVAVRERNQLDIDRMSESVQVSNTTYNVTANGNVFVTAQIQNTGPSSIQFLTIWIYASNSTPWSNHNFKQLDTTGYTVQGGSAYPLNINLTVTGIYTTSSYDITSWLITTRGNTIALPKQPAVTSNIVISQTTYGIGALMMDFQNFTYYNVTGSYPNYFLDLTKGGSGYYLQGTGSPKGQIALRVIFTNLDQNKRNIVLGNGSELFMMYPKRGSFQEDVWYIVYVNEATGAISYTYTPITLVYNVPTPIYFASSNRGTCSPVGTSYTGIAPVNLAIVGTIGSTTPFGQNIPFVSIDVVS
jgi:hypothetical protein